MLDLKEFKIQDFLRTSFLCDCGKEHSADIENIVIDKDAILALPELINRYNFKKIFMVADTNTYKIAGEHVETVLLKNGFKLQKHVFEGKQQLVPDEKAIGRLIVEIDNDTDLILAVGSGTLNDLSRFLSYKLKIPYFIVATAPSMDGYASTVSALIINNLKTTYETVSPKAIIADINIIKNAPMDMILAGLGDILGKYTSLCDWELGRIINEEYYCSTVVELVRNSIKKCAGSIEGIKVRNDEAIKNLMEGLVLSGIAMSFVGNSRPASGSEHHLAHFWEMKFLFDGKEAVLHGTKVGITTIAIVKLYEMLKTAVVDFNLAIDKVKTFNQHKWIELVNKTYKNAASGIIELEKKANKNSLKEHAKRISVIKERWNDIIHAIQELIPSTHEFEAILKQAGAPINPAQIGVDDDTVFNSVLLAKEIRNRYTILQLLWDIGLLEEFAGGIKNYFKNEQKNDKLYHNQNTKEILKKVKCFILDMDGTFYLGDKLIDGSIDFINSLGKYNKEFYFFTNNSSKNAEFYQNKLKKMGCNVEDGKVLISNQVIIKHIKQYMPGKKVYLLGTEYLLSDFTKAGIEITEDVPDLVVVGFDTTLQYDRLSKACDFIRNGIPVLAVNPDFNCPTEKGFIPDCGSICALITASTGVVPVFFGKPSQYTLQYILDYTGFQEREIAFIGDRLYTDMAIGKDNEAVTILVLSGETKEEDLAKSNIKPNLVFNSLKEIKAVLDEIYYSL
ncbi:HAD-IIA family hydrolase [Petroclostridium xylanilyticum]|uniref:HAD-IIA family hydrolase n=1 Tax=Petroclostridium xylanilyticum TaxID=1792311 RepID=UPI000B9952FC|nr:iron-containing alcohol dehydrogenase [Petroclostridium xylanilyticum]